MHRLILLVFSPFLGIPGILIVIPMSKGKLIAGWEVWVHSGVVIGSRKDVERVVGGSA
jgi:exopolysaccharide biosynthesis predicted pyruvyltransferase EpsI